MSSNDQVVTALSKLLADTDTVYLKTHNYHWNVTGPMFNTLHTLFETQYTEYALAVDEIAERIRAVGARAPGSYSEFAEIASVKEDRGSPPAMQMVENLAADQKTIVMAARSVVEAPETIGDQASADLGARRIQVHEKNAWMLRSHLE